MKKRYKHKIDWDVVKKLCQIQCTEAEIAAFLDISLATLMRRVEDKFECMPEDIFSNWRRGGRCSLRRKQWLLADKSASMAIFLGKQYLGQTDDYALEFTGDLNQKIVHFGDLPPKTFDEEEGFAEE